MDLLSLAQRLKRFLLTMQTHIFLFLVGVDGMMLVRYFGVGRDQRVDCLGDLGLSQIGPDAFSKCSRLKSVLVPASIEILGDGCFGDCSTLSEITFEPGSNLTEAGGKLCLNCSSLTSICIPAKLENIPKEFFSYVHRLLPYRSNLVRIWLGLKITHSWAAFLSVHLLFQPHL
jgi:hypothetical protein